MKYIGKAEVVTLKKNGYKVVEPEDKSEQGHSDFVQDLKTEHTSINIFWYSPSLARGYRKVYAVK